MVCIYFIGLYGFILLTGTATYMVAELLGKL